MLRESLLRARSDSIKPMVMPVASTARGAANHQLNEKATATALAAIVATLIPIAEMPIFFIFVTMSIKELSSVVENLVEIGVKIPAWLCKGLNVYTQKLDNLHEKEVE